MLAIRVRRNTIGFGFDILLEKLEIEETRLIQVILTLRRRRGIAFGMMIRSAPISSRSP
jgi:hypothetical protein